jgi:hypothetical protein
MDDPSEIEKSRPRLAAQRNEKGQIVKGTTLNPGGRPKGLASRVRDMTNQGEELLSYLLKVVKGEERASGADRIRAAELLLQRGFGKAPEIQLTGELGEEALQSLSDLGDDSVADLMEALTKKTG